PVLMWNASADELVPETSYLPTAVALDQAGYRYELDVFTAEHLTLAINDQFAPAAAFLGTDRVGRNPAHVTYVVNPSLDHADLRAKNIATATINVKRAGVDCNVALHITSDGPLTVNLAGCKRTVQVSGP